MPVICWGPLAKSASDPTTIPEYISGKILDHNVDPSAHGLDSYALYNHRDTYPVDHPDYSITSEKITSDWIIGKRFETSPNVGPGTAGVKFDPYGIQMYQAGERKVNIPISGSPFFEGDIQADFITFNKKVVMAFGESSDGWNQDEGVSGILSGLAWSSVEGNSDTPGGIWFGGNIPGDYYNFDRNPLFQIDWYSDYSDDDLIELLLGANRNIFSQFAGFKWKEGNLYAVHSNSDKLIQTFLSGYMANEIHRYKCIMISAEKIDFYIDGVLKATHTEYLPSGNNEWGFSIFHTPGSGDSVFHNFNNFLFVEDFS